MHPLVSIIVPVKNNEKIIEACIQSLINLNYPNDKIEIIIVDARSTDKTREIAQKYNLKVITDEGKGRAIAINTGVSHAQGEYIAFTDADCIADPNWIRNLLNYFNSEDIGGVGGPNIVPPNSSSFIKAIEYVSMLSPNAKKFDLAGEVDSIAGCNSIYRSDVLKKFIPLPEVGYIEDTLLNYRIRKANFKLVSAPDAIVWHNRHYSNLSAFFKQTISMGKGILEGARFEKDLIKPFHFLVGLSLPLIIVFFIGIWLLTSFSIALVFSCILLFILTIFLILKCLIDTKSLNIALYAPLIAFVEIFGYSIGFIVEFTKLNKVMR
jgi:cellulose synthase/poly-beta-1,6-N-acetylglucosamine synthase-like glycosyltransferase